MKRPIIKVSLFDAASENDFTLLEENGEYFVSFADRTDTYREFVRMLFKGEEPQELLEEDARANFLALMKLLSERWNDEFRAEFFDKAG